MGCINQKSNHQKLQRQSVYVTLQNNNMRQQVEITSERNQKNGGSLQIIQGVNSNDGDVQQRKQSPLKKTPQLDISNLTQFKQKVQALKQYQKRNNLFYQSHQTEFEEIMNQIKLKTITLQFLISKNDQLKLPLLDILSIINREGKTIIELILNHIDNFEIITQLFLENNLTEEHLEVIAIPLFRKLKNFNSDKNFQEVIKFLKATQKTKLLEVILTQSFKKGRKVIIQNFNNLFSYIDKQKESHLKLLKLLSRQVNGIEQYKNKYKEYLEASTEFKFGILRISKKIKIGHNEDQLEMRSTLGELKFNIFHQVSQNKRWDLFIQYSNVLIQNPNKSEYTPFMTFCQSAPFEIILKYIKQFPQQFTQGIEYSTSQGLNLLHCICQNKNLKENTNNDFIEIINILRKKKNIKKLLLEPYQDQIPLVYYLNCQKKINKQFLEFLGENLEKKFDFYKLDTLAQILGEQLKFRKINKNNILIKNIKNRKINAFNQSNFQEKFELPQEIIEQFNLFYLHYVQLMKIIMKLKFSINYSHLNQFFIFTSYFPYDLGTTNHSFLQIALQYLNDDFILQELQKFNFVNHIQNQKKELNKCKVQLPNDYSLEAQLLVKFIYLKRDIQDQSSQLHKEINTIILEQIKKDPKLLWAKIYGNSQYKYKEYSTTLYQLIKQLIDVLFVKEVLEISILNNLQYPQFDIMKEFVYQELLLKQVAKSQIELRKFCDSFPRYIEFKEQIIEKKIDIDDPTKKFQIKIFTLNLGLDETQAKIDISLFYLFAKHLQRKFIQNLIRQSSEVIGSDEYQKINMQFIKALLQQEITMPLINKIIDLNPKYFIPKIWWLIQNYDIKEFPLNTISLNHKINPITIFQPKINQFDLIFDWQMNDIKFNLLRFPIKQFINQVKTIKSQLIIFQYVNKLQFFVALAIDDHFNSELSTYLQYFQIEITKENISQIQLHMMIQNQASKNIQLLIDYFKLDVFSLIYMLGLNHFSNSNFFQYTPYELLEINKFNFNQQIQQLLKFNFKYSDQICTIFIYEKNIDNENEEPKMNIQKNVNKSMILQKPYFLHLISCFNYETMKMFDLKLRTSLYRRQNFQIYFDQIQDLRIFEILIDDLINIMRQELQTDEIYGIITKSLTISINKNYNVAEILCRFLTKEELVFSKRSGINLFEKISLISNQMCFKYLDKLTLQNYKFLCVYYQALAKENIPLLNYLINYYNENQLKVSHQYNYKHLSENVKNYYKALFRKYYLVLNIKQYESLFNTVKLSSTTISEHIKFFILFGYVEQLKFLIQQPALQNQMQDNYFEYMFTKKMCLENDLGYEVNKFPIKLREKTLQLQHLFLKKFQRTYQSSCIFSLSQIKCSFSFDQKKIDYQETLQILDQIMSKSNEQSQILIQHNQLYSTLLNPQAKEIELKSELIQYFLRIFIRTKSLNKQILDRYESFISLFSLNSKNIEIIFDFKKPKQSCKNFIILILIEYIQQLKQKNNVDLTIYEKLAEYILKYQLKSQKLVECLQIGLQKYIVTQFNNTTLFYLQNQVNILTQAYYDYSKNIHFYNRYNIIKRLMNKDEINLEKMTPIQVYLSKGKVDHLDQIKYSDSNLMAALISNDFITIQTILDKNQNPKKICSEFSLLLYMLKFQNEKNIIIFFNKYIENFIKDVNKLMVFENESILQSIVLQKQWQVFDCIIRQYLLKLTNNKTHYEIIQQHLKMKAKESDFMIYQLAISQKSYFIFDYLDGIIQADEIKELIKTVDLTLNQRLLEYQQGERKINQFAQYYLNSLQILSVPNLNLQSKKFFVKKTNEKINKQKIKRAWKKDKCQQKRADQINRFLDIEHACIYKTFGFNQFVQKYLERNFQFFTLFQNSLEDTFLAIDICKGHPKLIELCLNSMSQKDMKQNLEQIVRKCQQFYLIQNPIFYKVMLSFPEQFIDLLNLSDFNLEICLLLSCKLKQTTILQSFISRQLELYQNESQNINGIDNIQQNYLFMMSLFLNDFSLPILNTGFQCVTIELLIKSMKFLDQNFQKQTTKISSQGLNYIISLFNKQIVINNKQIFEQYINSQNTGYPVILGMIWIQQIEQIVQNFFSSLPKWGIFQYEVEITFDNVPISYNNQNYILPLKFNNDRFEFDDNLINQFISILKQIKFESIVQKESIRFKEFEEKWSSYDFKLLINNLTIDLIPLHCFDYLNEVDSIEENKVEENNQYAQQNVKQVEEKIQEDEEKIQEDEENIEQGEKVKQIKSKQLIKKQPENVTKIQQKQLTRLQEQNENFQKLYKTSLEKIKESKLIKEKERERQKKISFFEGILFFQSLLDPLEQNDDNYSITALDAPHKNQDVDTNVNQEAKYERYVSNQKNIKKLKEKIQLIKALLPKHKNQSSFINQQYTIFIEFYHYIYPKTTVIVLKPLLKQEYQQQYHPQAILDQLIKNFKQYYDNFIDLIKSEKYEKQTVSIPYYIEKDNFVYQEILFTPYAIQLIFSKFLQFVYSVRALTEFQIDIIQWRINTISVLQVLVQAILDSNFQVNKTVDIFSIIDSICQWNHLQLILTQIIYRNLMSLPDIDSLFSRIYVEFNEKSDSKLNCQFQTQSTQYLDQIFQFEKTEYKIYKKTLVITLNVRILKEQNLRMSIQSTSIQKKYAFNKSSIFKAQQMSFHLQNVINDSDFFFDVFPPAELVEYLFNRFVIDGYVQKFSRILSRFVNKDVAIIVNHQQLKNLYEDKIIEIQGNADRQTKIQKQNQIQSELIRLKEFFIEKVQKSFFEQLKSLSFQQLFEVQLSILLQSIRQNNQLLQSTTQNFRRAIRSRKSKVVERIAKFSTYKLLSFQFGFQLTPTYYQQRAKAGDFCMILRSIDEELQLIPCQFIANLESSFQKYYKLQEKQQALTSEEIEDKFRIEKDKINASDDQDALDINIEEIVSIIWFTSTWPMEQNFNSEILNLFFLDQNSNILACHEKRFLQKFSMIQNVENEQQKQLFLDNLFGENLVTSYAKFAVTQIIPIIPNQINYNFQFKYQKQTEVVKENNQIFITIDNSDEDKNQQNIDINQGNKDIDQDNKEISQDNFILGKLSMGEFNIACYYDSNQRIQKYVKKLNKFTHGIKEMSKIVITIHFDNELNSNPTFYLEQLFANYNIFEEFELGFKDFSNQKQYPMIDNSLSYLFDVISLSQVKERIFCQIVKSIKFHFFLNNNFQERINFWNGILTINISYESLKPFFNHNSNLNPFGTDISNFISNMIVNYEENGIQHLIIKDEMYDLQIDDEGCFHQEISNLANTILLIKYLYQLIQLHQNQKNTMKITFQLKGASSKQYYYQFSKQKRQIILFYNQLKDFSLDSFLLDYLNNNKFQGEIKYDDLVIDSNFLNQCQILQNQMIVKDNLYYPQIQIIDKKLFISKDFTRVQVLDRRLDPKEQERGFLIFQCNNIYQAMITLKSNAKYLPLYQYFKQTQKRQFYGQPFYILVSGIKQNIDLDTQLNKLQVRIIINNKKIKRLLNYYKRHTNKLSINSRLITTNIALVELIVQGVSSVKIRSTTQQLLMSACMNQNYSKSVMIQFDPDTSIEQTQNKLAHIGILIEESKQNWIYKTVSFSSKASNKVDLENKKIINFLLKGVGQKSQFKQKDNFQNTKIHMEVLQDKNTIATLNPNQIGVASFCGQMRTDFIEFLDVSGGQIPCDNTVFIHNLFQQIQFYPKVFKEALGFKFKWQPNLKGIYNLFIGDQKIQGQFIVLAHKIDHKNCEIIQQEKIEKLTLYQSLKFVIKLRDHYNNIYGDIEQKLNPIQPKVEIKHQFSDKKIDIIGPNREGIITLNIIFTQKEDIEHQPEKVQVKITLVDELQLERTFNLEGLTLEMRIIKYYEKLNVPKIQRELKINRSKFGNEMLKLAETQFKCPLKIKFIGELGSDDGGLRREFYNKVGEMIKSPQNQFFKLNQQTQTYFFENKFNLLEKKQKLKYALIFGKLIANSILNKELIGVPFAHQFWKLIFNKKIQFEDLDGILDGYQLYKSLRQQTQEYIESISINFVISTKTTPIKLIPNGDSIPVTTSNVELYLQRTAEYFIIEEFQDIIKTIREGFDSVLDKQQLMECLDETEMHTLTVGANEIQSQNVLELVKYENASDQLISYFQTFINSLEKKQLHEFLQFTTGSPHLPWNAKPTIFIEFSDKIPETNLPRSATCFYKLTIPSYKSYEEFKKKMEIAIEYGQEGFGQF